MASASHPSDSAPQRAAEAALLVALSREFGFTISGERIDLGDGAFANVDGVNRDNRLLCEIYSRIGTLQAAQVEKVASDILKLTVVEKILGGAWKKILCFADQSATRQLRGTTWVALAARQARIEIVVLPLPSDIHDAVLTAQRRQVMVNAPTVDG